MFNRSAMTVLIILSSVLIGCQKESTTPATLAHVVEKQAATVPTQAASAASAPTMVVAPVTPPPAPTPKVVAKSVTPPVVKPVVATTKTPVSTVIANPVIVAEVVTPEAKTITTQPAAANQSTVLTEAAALQLAGKSNCLACHAINKKLVGPAWKSVADKYRGDNSAQNRLETKVSKGGSGAWGSMAMPANSPRVKPEDISSLVRFILSLQ